MIRVGAPAYDLASYRPAAFDDLRQLTAIDERSAPWWVRRECWTVLRTPGGGGEVAEIDGRAVGFILYSVAPPPEQPSLFRRLLGHCHLSRSLAGQLKTRHIQLCEISVGREFRRLGIGSGLLDRVHRRFSERGDIFEAVIPEANLGAQLFLQQFGYRATAILHGRCDRGDRYLMRRHGALLMRSGLRKPAITS